LIAVDTSALVAVILKEPRGPACLAVLEGDAELVISAGTLTEALIVARGRDISEEMQQLIDAFAFNVIPVTDASARRAAAAYEVWGRGVHPAALNYGDCFAYEVAKDNNCPLLFVGDDFAKTDLQSALIATAPE
jgi:ribonuclease VapC